MFSQKPFRIQAPAFMPRRCCKFIKMTKILTPCQTQTNAIQINTFFHTWTISMLCKKFACIFSKMNFSCDISRLCIVLVLLFYLLFLSLSLYLELKSIFFRKKYVEKYLRLRGFFFKKKFFLQFVGNGQYFVCYIIITVTNFTTR